VCVRVKTVVGEGGVGGARRWIGVVITFVCFNTSLWSLTFLVRGVRSYRFSNFLLAAAAPATSLRQVPQMRTRSTNSRLK
jgi:hypothetical protein